MSRSITVPGVALDIEERGKERPRLFLHPGEALQPIRSWMDSLARTHRVIAPNHPGFGGSALPDWFGTVEDIAYLFVFPAPAGMNRLPWRSSTGHLRVPRTRWDEAASDSVASERADNIRRQPSAPKALAVARPIPRLAPVISTILSLRCRSMGQRLRVRPICQDRSHFGRAVSRRQDRVGSPRL
jgi:hypothetical protein